MDWGMEKGEKSSCNCKAWLSMLREYEGEYIDSPAVLRRLLIKYPSHAFCAPCSKTKSGLLTAFPKEFYVSARLLRFYQWCEKNNQLYGILSDKYGIRWMDQKLKYYDIHPSGLSTLEFQSLGKKIAKECIKRGINVLIFQNSSPLMSRPYFKMLFYSNIKFYYISKLHSITKKGFEL